MLAQLLDSNFDRRRVCGCPCVCVDFQICTSLKCSIQLLPFFMPSFCSFPGCLTIFAHRSTFLLSPTSCPLSSGVSILASHFRAAAKPAMSPAHLPVPVCFFPCHHFVPSSCSLGKEMTNCHFLKHSLLHRLLLKRQWDK